MLLPIAIVESMEKLVTDEAVTPYLRIYAWFRLVKLWAGMRFNDTQGVPAHTMSFDDSLLKGEIHRSKIFGAGKRLGILGFYVSKQAWLVEQDRLKFGWRRDCPGVTSCCLLQMPSRMVFFEGWQLTLWSQRYHR